ncbi:DDE-type integrase/transposase/recombinase [Pseudomonas putida]|uniref:DNA-binding domain-containing protein n=1 Tax=Pseudomonas putida TaxID=303 RepID=UPI0023646768|nr:DDE-type integrase/transposase/recombinase [Pseudomonas putida]MDD2024932.1 DDE-type integrase/transposase/recombinase [Pseudomonas putida]HDS1765331.1 DDE-type integrase/transposase/recombinase [Pseudomonas putida]
MSVTDEGLVLNRGTLNIQVGEFVEHLKCVYRILVLVDFHHVLGQDVESGLSKMLPIAGLQKPEPDGGRLRSCGFDLQRIADKDWAVAERRYAVIAPLLAKDMYVQSAVLKRAEECGVSSATIYRWLYAYGEGSQFLSLLPHAPGWKKGNSRVAEGVEDIIGEVIQTLYLSTRRATIKDVSEEVEKRCKEKGFRTPSIPTITRRIRKIPRKKILRARGYSELASNTYDARPGKYSADYPLHRIQIDHSPADVIIVDDIHRHSIGRPWVTMAIDMYSRMVVGYYISLEAPSAVSVAMCLVQAMLPKHEWLNHHSVVGEWPVWGKPHEIHSDNGPDFKAKALIQSCTAHGIDRQFRPRKKPHWGGHIESLMEGNAKVFSKLAGATQRNPEDRGDVNSDKEATMSFDALEAWLIHTILIYNNKPHSGLEFKPPIKMWSEAFWGPKAICGMPPMPEDPLTLQIDFLPADYRTIHPYGVEWSAIYYAEALRPWISHVDPATGKKAKFLFRRDTRDINFIWFFDPGLERYFKIPLANHRFEGVSVAEYVATKRERKKHNLGSVDDVAIARSIEAQRQIEQAEAVRTKDARRQAQRMKNKSSGKTPATVLMGQPSAPKSTPTVDDAWGDDDVTLYGGVA